MSWTIAPLLLCSARRTIRTRQYFSRNVERSICCWQAAIQSSMQQQFLDFVIRYAAVRGRPQMQSKRIGTVESDEHGNRQQATRMPRQSRAVPHLAPGVSREELLEFAV